MGVDETEVNDSGPLDELFIDPARERRLVRKLDIWLSPMMILLFLMSYLDRSNIGRIQIQIDALQPCSHSTQVMQPSRA
jgi:hypothetical protein